MTNEEAIRILESMKSEMLLVFDHDRKEALKLAITALRAQNVPDTNVGDTISRQAAIGIFTQLWDCIGTIMDRDEWEDICRTTANELPSARQWMTATSNTLVSNTVKIPVMDGVTDYIRRQDAIKTLCERRCGDKPKGCPSGFCTESLAVDCIPSAQQWIPVSERLPKVKEQPYYEDEHQVLRESKQILMWAKMPSTGKFGYAIGSLIADDGEEKGHQWNGIFDDLDEIDPYHPEWVVAWMPLPSPYKEDSE